ncbi:MAG TPA: glutaredoxin family protein [Candidatus Angelobacter sp.]|nr:glutaredoxin family protein [Candidatus Angelobacter sp.]
MTPHHIVMYTKAGCEDSDAAREFLKQHHIPFEEVDIGKNREALEFVMSVNEGKQRTPTFNMDGRAFHCSQFEPRKLARELDLPDATQAQQPRPKTP